MSSDKFCALVPMKGHSERIPNKNIKQFVGRPLFHWVLESLSQVSSIDRVVINTDSEEIARSAAENFDVTIHERPQRLCGDFVSMNRIIDYDLSLLSNYNLFVQTHSTNPLLRPQSIEQALVAFLDDDSRFDSLFSVTRHQARFFGSEGEPINHDPSELKRTQDLPPLFEENSNFYIFSRHSFADTGQRIGRHPGMRELAALEAIDIDVPDDWKLAEALLKQRLRKQ
jgi:CMP-N-acetylneuraminic acid synthetase